MITFNYLIQTPVYNKKTNLLLGYSYKGDRRVIFKRNELPPSILILFIILLSNPLEHGLLFFGMACLGGISLSLVFSFLAAIAAKASQPSAIMAILGFPLIIPQLMLLMKITNIAFSDIVQNGLAQMVGLLCGFDIMIIALAYILFPFLWKD